MIKKFYCGKDGDWQKKIKKLLAGPKAGDGKTSCSLKKFCYNEIIERRRTIYGRKNKGRCSI